MIAGPSRIFHGWRVVLDRNRRNLPDGAAIGRLAYTDPKITPLSADAALIRGPHREAGPRIGEAKEFAHHIERVAGVAPPVAAVVSICGGVANNEPRTLPH